ncbi:DUF4097 family beta strand repeat-containing protein [Psychrobacillus psychrodurans]|uniref:DUF4097 domain-containing protein n=1 Tax=Psychrobacillus psychrodurans TaxID=126157 RepID=A0A9X3L702_9BACI|nr:DUF4097 family beta strand repeat-containing protein [Psychrobacillus psychrodurans]MCZ8532538.1 DUF4097 domain-containing protein [Psychrobacillus psychrodurans]
MEVTVVSIKKIGIIAIIVVVLGAAINVGMNIAGGFIKNTEKIELAEEFSRIDIAGDNTAIEVVRTSASNGKVEFISKKNSSNKLNAYVEGDTLHVKMKKKLFNVFDFGFNFSGNKIIVSVPDEKYDELTTQTSNGQIFVQELQFENIEIESNNGKIVLEDLESKMVNVKTNNGKIDLHHVNGDIQAESDNGQISMVTDNLDRSITLETNNGLVDIRTTSEPKNATIQAEIDNGRIDIFGSSNEKTVFGNGENMISINTDNGIISLKKGN